MEQNEDFPSKKNFTLKSDNLTGQATAREVLDRGGCTGINSAPHL